MSIITYCEMCREYNAAAVDYRNQAANAQAENKALLARHNALVEAVAWERECEELRTWLIMTKLYPRKTSARWELYDDFYCARAEVDRLIANERGDE